MRAVDGVKPDLHPFREQMTDPPAHPREGTPPTMVLSALVRVFAGRDLFHERPLLFVFFRLVLFVVNNMSSSIRELAAHVQARPLLALLASNCTTAVLVGIYVKGQSEGGVVRLLKKLLFSLALGSLRVVAKGTVSKEQDKLKKKTTDMVLKHIEGERTRILPAKGVEKKALLERMQKASDREQIWRKGMVSGTVYHGGDDILDVISAAFRAFAVSNPLHPDGKLSTLSRASDSFS